MQDFFHQQYDEQRFVCQKKISPWIPTDKKDPGARRNMPICFAWDVRMVETRADAVITADWIPNYCIVFGYDAEKHFETPKASLL